MKYLLSVMLFALLTRNAFAQEAFEKDIIGTAGHDLEITFIGHASLMMKFDGRIIYVDPYSKLADYSKLLKADLILITHHHPDHLDVSAIGPIMTKNTKIVLTEKAAEAIPGGMVMKNGEQQTVAGIRIEAVPAYNIVHKRDSGEPYHPKGQGNGYVLTLGEKRVYVAGDTENIPEMKDLKNIAIAFLPMNLPYTMTPEMVADAARKFRPRLLYPYHYGETDPSLLPALLKQEKDIEVRLRKMK